MGPPGHLRIHAELGELAGLREFVRTGLARMGASAQCVDELVQAVDEAATNSIVHGYAGAPGWLDVSLSSDGDRCEVTIVDDAPIFDPTDVPEPDLALPPAVRAPGGMGVHLIRLAVDAVDHRPRPGGGNILTMVRSLGTRAEEGE